MFHRSASRGRLAGWALSFLSAAVGAQTAQLPSVAVTGSALRAPATAAPVTVLEGDGLVQRRGSTLADTLAGTPGVSSTWFGPNANRPTIRGQDGDRIRVLANGGASFDASSLSFDHAVPIDPLVAERVEVLRGPDALLYGGSATGGVVNTVDNRIPAAPITRAGGAAELRLGGASGERGGAALIEAGNGRVAWHADVFGRTTDDLRVPRFAPPGDGGAQPRTGRVRNSASRSEGGALGVALTGADSSVGVSADRYRSTYGIVVEPDVTIRMRREQITAAGDWRRLSGPIVAVRARLADTRYRHEEVEGGGEVGTTFRNAGRDARVEVDHAPLGPWRGTLGVQWERFDFSALGEEAFVPVTHTRHAALFAVEEAVFAWGTLGAGVRLEQARLASEGDAPGAAEPRFGAAQARRFAPRSVSLAWHAPAQGAWTLGTTFALTERAPTSFELYANGVHAATGQFERGDPTLGVERGTHLELSAERRGADGHLRAAVFATRFGRYLLLAPTGRSIDDGEASLPEVVFRATPARLAGVELEAARRWLAAGWSWEATGAADVTRGTDRATGDALPRLAPLRLRFGLTAQQGGLGLEAALEHATRQDRPGPLDSATAAWTRLDLAARWRAAQGGRDLLWFARVDNLFDALAFHAASSPAVRGLAPLPGRAWKVGFRAGF
jgi:iron complex outermembrane receptor protein